ncbi:MAG: cupin domain-containing protein [Candidatus Heimdallarchaeota archaeon]
MVKIVGLETIKVVHRPGRTIKVFTNPDTLDVSNMTQGIVWFEPGEVSRPCHAHLISDETIFVIQGKGQVYVDGNLAEIKYGTVVLFPKGSKHMIRNTGTQVLEILFTVIPPITPENEAYYKSIKFPEA